MFFCIHLFKVMFDVVTGVSVISKQFQSALKLRKPQINSDLSDLQGDTYRASKEEVDY
jgi:ABC-type phosphate transport system auxiliary subunit